MIRIAIVEDEDSYVQVLTGYLKQYETEHSLSFQISVFHDGLDIVSEYKADYDIILLDIQMKHLDGMTTAEKIRELDEDVSFIFITSTIQFAVQGYLVDALGYVVKPVAYLAIFSDSRKSCQKGERRSNRKDYMTIEVEGGQMRLDIGQIYYIESQRHQHSVPYRKRGFSHCRTYEKDRSASKRQRIFQMP
ncbi:MAG: LytR/AlgR family response regulator transcription factor [Mediterraneibacter gnavus]